MHSAVANKCFCFGSLCNARLVELERSNTDHITLEDYEIHDGMGLELYYQ